MYKATYSLFFLMLWAVSTLVVQAAFFELNPPAGSYIDGDIIPVDVYVDTQGESINAVSGEIAFSQEMLSPVSVVEKNSIVDVWLIRPSVSGGVVVFEGLALSPGFSGRGKVATINFKVSQPGQTDVVFKEGLILKNDGLGTNILTHTLSAAYELIVGQGVPERAALPPPLDEVSTTTQAVAPVILSYAADVRSLDEFYVRGLTYPKTSIELFIQDEERQIESFGTVSDGGGNFEFTYKKRNQIPLSANVFAILDAWSGSLKETQYQFWARAIIDGSETEPTQTFTFTAGGSGVNFVEVAVIVGALLLLVSVLLFFFHKRSMTVVRRTIELEKDLDEVAYDIEKYEAHKRQDTQ